MQKRVSISYLFEMLFKRDWLCLGITLIKLHWFVTPMDICPNAKNNLTTQTFFELLELQESRNLIG